MSRPKFPRAHLDALCCNFFVCAGTILKSSTRVLEVLGSYKVSKTTQTFILARKFDISHWFTCGADGRRTYGHVITKVSQMDRLTNFLSYGAPLIFLDKLL